LFVLVFIISFISLKQCNGYLSIHRGMSLRSTLLFANSAKPGSYTAMLEQAQLRKSKKIGNISNQSNSLTSSGSFSNDYKTPASSSQIQVTAPVATAKSSNNIVKSSPTSSIPSNGLPFTDEIYEHLKYVISKLSTRMKSQNPLTNEEFDKFSKSISAIIDDIKINTPEVLTLESAQEVDWEGQQGEELSSVHDSRDSSPAVSSAGKIPVESRQSLDMKDKDAFSAFKGSKSTWQIPGMDKMTTKEYYEAINQRLGEIRNMRKSDPGYDRDGSASYMASLSRK